MKSEIGTRPRRDLTADDPRPPAERPHLLRFPAVRACTGLSRTTIWRLERQGCFPKHVRISKNAVAWFEGDVIAWMRSKVRT